MGATRDGPTNRVVIADDHIMFRQGVVEMLGTAEEIGVVGEAEDGERASWPWPGGPPKSWCCW
jgi:DNA-binding NarL/FixJ family response regulator